MRANASTGIGCGWCSEEHLSLVAELMHAIKDRWPNALIQFGAWCESAFVVGQQCADVTFGFGVVYSFQRTLALTTPLPS